MKRRNWPVVGLFTLPVVALFHASVALGFGWATFALLAWGMHNR